MSTNTTVRPTFRAAVQADAATLEHLVHLAYRSCTSSVSWKNEGDLVQGPRIQAPELKELIASDRACIIVAELKIKENPETVGCVLVEQHGDEAHIGLLAVSPDHQNLGLGKQLVRAGERCAHDHFKCGTGKMFVLSQRDQLLNWYESLGYTRTGKTSPFPGPETGLTPLIEDPHFIVITKALK